MNTIKNINEKNKIETQKVVAKARKLFEKKEKDIWNTKTKIIKLFTEYVLTKEFNFDKKTLNTFNNEMNIFEEDIQQSIENKEEIKNTEIAKIIQEETGYIIKEAPTPHLITEEMTKSINHVLIDMTNWFRKYAEDYYIYKAIWVLHNKKFKGGFGGKKIEKFQAEIKKINKDNYEIYTKVINEINKDNKIKINPLTETKFTGLEILNVIK